MHTNTSRTLRTPLRWASTTRRKVTHSQVSASGASRSQRSACAPTLGAPSDSDGGEYNPVRAVSHKVLLSPSARPSKSVVPLARLVNWGNVHDLRQRSSAALANRNQVQRILRRMPLGETDHELYFNELPSNLKRDLVKVAYYTRALSSSTNNATTTTSKQKATHTDDTLDAAIATVAESQPEVAERDLRALVSLRGPQLTVARDKIRAHRRHIEKQGAAYRCEAPAHGVPADMAEASLVLPNLASTATSLGLAWCAASGSVTVATANTAARTHFSATPSVYVLGIPEPLLAISPITAHPADNANEVVMAWLQHLLSFDVSSQELLLRTAAQQSDAPPLQRHVFLTQTYSFNPHAAHRVLCRDDPRRPPEQRYRLFFLMPSGTALNSGSEEIWHLLRAAGATFPSRYTSYQVDIQTGGGVFARSDSLPSPWTPLRMKRLQRDGVAPDLWSSQVGGRKVQQTSGSHEASSGASAASTSTGSRGESTAPAAVLAAERLRVLQRVFAAHYTTLLRRAQRDDEHVPPNKVKAGTLHGDDGDGDALNTTTSQNVEGEGVEGILEHDGMSLSAERRSRMAFVVAEYAPADAPINPSATPCEDTCRADVSSSWLPLALHEALYHRRVLPCVPPHEEPDTGAGQEALSPLFLSTSGSDLTFARERVLLPFLRRPRHAYTATRESADGCSSAWVWSVEALEARADWRARFSSRYGSFQNLLTPELITGLGMWQTSMTCASTTTPLPNASPRRPALAFLHDRGFIESVMLPALTTFAEQHYRVDEERGVLQQRTASLDHDAAPSASWNSLRTTRTDAANVLDVLSAAPEVAAAVQYRRLNSWCTRLLHASPARQRAWLQLDLPCGDALDDTPFDEDKEGVSDEINPTHTPTSMSADDDGLRKIPISIRPFLRHTMTRLAASHPPHGSASEERDAVQVMRGGVRVVPIRLFLQWLADDSQGGDVQKSQTILISHRDEQQAMQYFAGWSEYFTLAGGITTTVAFSVL